MADPTETPIEATKKPSKLDSAKTIYDSLIEGRDLQTSVNYGVSLNPDAAAKQQSLAKEFNVPLDLAASGEKELDLASRRKKILRKLEGTQILKSMMKDPRFAAIAQDDLSALADIETSIGVGDYLGGVASEFAIGSALAVEGIKAQWWDLIGAAQESVNPDPAVMEDIKARQRKFTSDYSIAQEIRAEETPNFVTTEAEAFYSGVTSFARQLPGLALGVVAGPGAGLGYMGLMTEAEAYLKYRERGGTRGEALSGAMLEGGIEVLTEKIPMDYFVSKFGKDGMAQFLGRILAREMPTEIAATVGQEFVDTMIANPDKTLADYRDELPGNIYHTMIATLAHAGLAGAINVPAVIGARRYGGDVDQAQRATDAAAKLDKLVDTATNSSLRERSPEDFRKFIERQLGAEESVYMAPDDAKSFFQTNPEVLESLPEQSRQAITEALSLESDVAIPKADYLTYFTDFHAEIADILRNDMDGMTTAEAKRWSENLNEEFETAANEILSGMDQESDFAQSAERVHTSIRDQLVASGRMTPETASRNAEIYRSFSVVTAQKMNITPEQVMEKFGLKVQGAPMEGIEGLSQAETAEYQSALDKGLDMSTEARMANEIQMPEQTITTEDGEVVTIQMTAQQALDDVSARIDVLEQLRECIG